MYMYLYTRDMGAHRVDAEHFIANSKTSLFWKQRDSDLEMSVTVSAHSRGRLCSVFLTYFYLLILIAVLWH